MLPWLGHGSPVQAFWLHGSSSTHILFETRVMPQTKGRFWHSADGMVAGVRKRKEALIIQKGVLMMNSSMGIGNGNSVFHFKRKVAVILPSQSALPCHMTSTNQGKG